MNVDIEKALDDYDYARLGICAYFKINCYPVLYTDVYWRLKTRTIFGRTCEFLEFNDEDTKPTGDPSDKYYLKYAEEIKEMKEKDDYTIVKLRDEGWAVLDNKKKVT